MIKTKRVKLYYTEPSEDIFREVRGAAVKMWEQMGSKRAIIVSNMKNEGENFMKIVTTFNVGTQIVLMTRVSNDAIKEVNDRLMSMPKIYYFFGYNKAVTYPKQDYDVRKYKCDDCRDTGEVEVDRFDEDSGQNQPTGHARCHCKKPSVEDEHDDN